MSAGRAPFQTRISHFLSPIDDCDLPFVIGGATQNHWGSAESLNSQDALAICIKKNIIVGIVTDGCTGTHPELENSSNSSNEVGAKLIAYLISKTAMTLASTQLLPADIFVKELSKIVREKLRAMLTLFAEEDALNREMFAYDFLMATVLGLVVTDSQFIVFHCGDGVIALNNQVHILDSESGTYLASELVSSFTGPIQSDALGKYSLKLFASGAATDLENIFLATDGLARLVSDQPSALATFLSERPPTGQSKNGFDFLLQEFRRKLAWNSGVPIYIDDDATFTLLRRYEVER